MLNIMQKNLQGVDHGLEVLTWPEFHMAQYSTEVEKLHWLTCSI